MTFREFLESKHSPAAGIFFTDDCSVLLLKRAAGTDDAGTWGLPGGHAKEHESPLQCARREVTEEVGTVKGKKVGQLNQDWWTVFFYRVEKPFDVKISSEHDNWAWIKFDNLKDYKLHPEFKKQYKKYISYVHKH